MKFNPKGLVVTAGSGLVLWAALATRRAAEADVLLLNAAAACVVVGSVAILHARIQGRPVAGQAGALREVLRWLTRSSTR